MKYQLHSYILCFLFLVSHATLAVEKFHFTFSAGGATHQYDSIVVQNLTSNQRVTLLAHESLTLNYEVTNNPTTLESDHTLKIFPNSENGRVTVQLFTSKGGSYDFYIYHLNGSRIWHKTNNLQAGLNTLHLNVPEGTFIARISGNGYQFSTKILSLSSNQWIGFSKQMVDTKPLFTSSSTKSLTVQPGDDLLLDAFSGKFRTIKAFKPTDNTHITFDFYECTDASGNHYPVIVIGNRVWMAENLRTTNFRNGERVPMFHATHSGYLYPWSAVIDQRKLAPKGWYIPTETDWQMLEDFLIRNGSNFDGSITGNKIAAAMTNKNAPWMLSENAGAPGNILAKNNTTGFGAIPTGFLNSSGNLVNVTQTAAYWSSSFFSNDLIFTRKLEHNHVALNRELNSQTHFFAIRGVRPLHNEISLPVVSTLLAQSTSATSAKVEGFIHFEGGSTLTEIGFCWNKTGQPTVSDSKVSVQTTENPFTAPLTGLDFDSRYFVRAYAINADGITYGNELSFNTPVLNVFDIGKLPEITLTVSVEEWNKLLLNFDQNPFNEEHVRANFRFSLDGSTTNVQSVGLRIRGNTSRRRPEGQNNTLHNPSNPDWNHASFSVDINEFVPGQRFAGLRKINLKWFKDDPMYVREIYCYDLFHRFGVWTAPRNSYGKLYIQVGENAKPAYFGVYALLESIDNTFLNQRRANFGSTGGFLWKAFWGADFVNDDPSRMGIEHVTLTSTYKPVYDLKNRHESLNQAKLQLQTFIRNLNQRTGSDFENWIESITDVPLLLRTYAVSVMCGMWDDYWNNKNNFYFYFNNEGKFFFIPFDYDNTLGTTLLMNDAGRRDLLHWGNNAHPLIRKIIDRPKYRALYIQYLHELANPANDLFHVQRSIPRIQQWHRLISSHLANDTGEGMVLLDQPASWGNTPFYRLLETTNNFFSIRASHLPSQ